MAMIVLRMGAEQLLEQLCIAEGARNGTELQEVCYERWSIFVKEKGTKMFQRSGG